MSSTEFRRRIINRMLDLTDGGDHSMFENDTQLDSNSSNTSSDSGDISDEEDLEDTTPSHIAGLSPEDYAQYLELQSIENQLEDFHRAPFNVAELRFHELKSGPTTDAQVPDLLDVAGVLNMLPPAPHATKQLTYILEGYQSLLVRLDDVQSSAAALESKRVDLKTIITIEKNRLIDAVYAERELQSNQGDLYEGVRRIHLASSSTHTRSMSPAVKATLVLIAIVHCMMGVAQDHCNFILKCLRAILTIVAETHNTRARLLALDDVNVPITLPTALHHLGLLDDIATYVACPGCSTIYKENSDNTIPETCTATNIDGLVCDQNLFSGRHRGSSHWQKPKRRFSHQPLESWLSRFLNRPGIEDLLEAASPSPQSTCTDVWGASYLSTFPGNDEPNFFDSPPDELRLAFLVYHDFFNPFGNKQKGKKRSIGLVMMVCLNLPPDVRYDLKNIYVTAMIPGPKEPALENINSFVQPIVSNLIEHYSPGVFISKTFKYARGRRVRSAVPISSLDIPASRAWAGLGSASHTIFCSFCDAILPEIDIFNTSHFEERSMDDHRIHVERWLSARNSKERSMVWLDHAARHSEWLRFAWWNPFKGTTIAPMHWTKNVIEKQVRHNMGSSATKRSGLPGSGPALDVPALALQWGKLAVVHLSEEDFQKTKFPEPLLRYLCRERGIFEAGLSSNRLIHELNQWRKNSFIINADGSPAKPEKNHVVAMAKAEYYLSKVDESTSILETNSTVPALQGLCVKFGIPITVAEKKSDLVVRLISYRNDTGIKPTDKPETIGSSKQEVSILGKEIISELRSDMEHTTIPAWLKTPPLNFATTDQGKIGAEEYKSLALVSLPITLIRLWGDTSCPFREYLDHFLHLSLAVRILAYQSITAHDIALFEFHYQEYLVGLKRLYPSDSITPVQHLGLHIPYFLRALGPSTRYNENTAEMFIGILEDISTSSRFGELEQTLHRELVMAANLKAMLDQQSLSGPLAAFGGIVRDFLRNRYPGGDRTISTSWQASHNSRPVALSNGIYDALTSWAVNNNLRPFTRHLLVCTKLRRGNVVYQPFTESTGNSCILFRPRGQMAPIPGRLDAIFQEPDGAATDGARVVLVGRAFEPLNSQDQARDPYSNHPLVGRARFGIMGLFYDLINDQIAHIIEPNDIVSHISVTTFNDPARMMSAPCVVVVDLDLKHEFHD